MDETNAIYSKKKILKADKVHKLYKYRYNIIVEHYTSHQLENGSIDKLKGSLNDF